MTEYQFIIITPSYNQAIFLGQTVDSVLSQPELLHYIVADGGSKDGSVAVLKKYKSKKLSWVSEADKGQTDAINKGIKKILKNKQFNDNCIVAYINSDDYYLENTFKKVAKLFIDQPDKEWLIGDAIIIDANNTEIQKPIRFYKKIWRKFLNSFVLGILNPIPQPAVFIKLSAIRKTGLFTKKLQYVMDYEYWLRLFKSVGKPIVTDTPLAYFRIHHLSKGGMKFKEQFKEQYQVAKKFIKNPLVLFLQAVHNLLITSIYSLIK